MNPVQISDDLALLFGSPVIKRPLSNAQDINPALASLLRAEREAHPEPSTSSIRGWQSNTDLARRNHPEVMTVVHAIFDAVAELTAIDLGKEISPGDLHVECYAWGNILSNGGMTHLHNHAVRATWSAVYFVSAEAGDPDKEENGYLVLADPRPIQVISGADQYRQPIRNIFIPPVDGSFVVFPGWMNHYVTPYFGTEDRITIALNATIDLRARPA